ncbi:hypothetical protein RRG08_016288 [Elysia crispata]|uniref:Uncharacterized protein n=1 Tax=Elysia crispata TaxID=231223 RepID=A0AAE1B730_9GAST|nr:hypothetical protein RRG08_016288 [Elysia crispata]
MHLLSRGLEPETSNPHTSRLFTSVYVTSVACQGDAGTSRWAVSLSGCRGRSKVDLALSPLPTHTHTFSGCPCLPHYLASTHAQYSHLSTSPPFSSHRLSSASTGWTELSQAVAPETRAASRNWLHVIVKLHQKPSAHQVNATHKHGEPTSQTGSPGWLVFCCYLSNLLVFLPWASLLMGGHVLLFPGSLVGARPCTALRGHYRVVVLFLLTLRIMYGVDDQSRTPGSVEHVTSHNFYCRTYSSGKLITA